MTLEERGELIAKIFDNVLAIEGEWGLGREVLEWMLLELNPDSEKWDAAFRDACMEWDV
jgi:hypothetical protein